MKTATAIALATAALLLARPLQAQDADKAAPTAYFTMSGGYSVYKSEMVQNNDTSTTIAYGFGIWAGKERNLGMALSREQSTFTFKLNGASVAPSFQDTHLRYRYGPVYAGLAFTNGTWIVKAPPDADGDGKLDDDTDAADYLDVVTSGYGATVGFSAQVAKRNTVFANLLYGTTQTVQQKPLEDSTGTPYPVDRTVSFGARMELDMGGTLDITRDLIDGVLGFKYRSYQVTADNQTYAELLTTTYLGLNFNWYF